MKKIIVILSIILPLFVVYTMVACNSDNNIAENLTNELNVTNEFTTILTTDNIDTYVTETTDNSNTEAVSTTEIGVFDSTSENDPNSIATTEAIESDVQKFDFTPYAGRYVPCSYIAEHENVSDIVLSLDGIITGGMTSTYGDNITLSATVPLSITENEDKSITCIIRNSDNSEFYIIYPAGVKDRNDMFDSSKIRIEYVISGGGILGYTYYKDTNFAEQEESMQDEIVTEDTIQTTPPTENTNTYTEDDYEEPAYIEGYVYVPGFGYVEIQDDGPMEGEDAFNGQSFWDILNDPNNPIVGE